MLNQLMKKLQHLTGAGVVFSIVVYSNANNNGHGGWDTHYPQIETEEDLDAWFKNNQYNSMVEAHVFETVAEALEYYNLCQ